MGQKNESGWKTVHQQQKFDYESQNISFVHLKITTVPPGASEKSFQP